MDNIVGAKYFVFTSKHHDGFSNWPSKHNFGWNSRVKENMEIYDLSCPKKTYILSGHVRLRRGAKPSAAKTMNIGELSKKKYILSSMGDFVYDIREVFS